MKSQFALTIISVTLGITLTQAWPGDWGGIRSAYAQSQTLVKNNTIQTTSQSIIVSDSKKFMGPDITIQSTNVDIAVTAGSPGRIHYDLNCAPAKRSGLFVFGWQKTSQKVFEREKVQNTVSFDATQGKLIARSGKHWSCRVDVRIPTDVQLDIETVNGDIHVFQRQGETRELSVNGDIKIQGSNGSVHVRTESGNILVKKSDGPIHAESGSGDISIISSGPHCRAKTESGNIIFSPTVLKPSQCIEAYTESGDIKVSRPWKICDQSTVSLQAESGDITIK